MVQGLISTFSGNPLFESSSSDNLTNIDSIIQQERIALNSNLQLDDDPLLTDNLIVINNDTISFNPKKEKNGYEYKSEAELDTIQWSNRIVERFFLYRGFYLKPKSKTPSWPLTV